MPTELIDPEAWTTASEAARLLGVTPQRVLTMADEGTIDVLRPWPRVALISMASVQARLDGERAERIMPADARRFVLARFGADSVHTLRPEDVQASLNLFIEGARPRWDLARRLRWAAGMTGRLLTTGAS